MLDFESNQNDVFHHRFDVPGLRLSGRLQLMMTRKQDLSSHMWIAVMARQVLNAGHDLSFTPHPETPTPKPA